MVGPAVGKMPVRSVWLVLLVAATSVVALIGWSYADEFLAVDSCLDSGGSFDYTRMVCDHEESHPFIPYSHRHPLAVVSALAAVVVAVSAAGAIHRPKQGGGVPLP